MKYVFLNDKILPRDEARIPIDDRGFLFGDGIFTSIKLCDGRLEAYHAHLKRLKENSAALNILPPSIDIALLRDLAIRNDALQGIWRLKIIFTGGATELRRMKPRSHGHLLITLEKQSERPSSISCLAEYPHSIAGPTAKLKSLSYLNRLCVADYASSQECEDALVLSPEGWMLESAFANIFWRTGENIYTPDPELPIMAGVSLGIVEKCANILGFRWLPTKAQPTQLPAGSQFYLTNSMMGIVSVKSYLHHHFIRDEEFENLLRETYRKVVIDESVTL